MHVIGMLLVTVIIIALTSRADSFDKAYAASQQGQVDAAIYHYTQAVESGGLSRENLARALNNRAVAYYQKGLYDRALADLDRAIQVAPEDLEIIRNREATYRATGGGRPSTQPVAHASAFPGGLRVQERIKLFGLL